jgi:hypothetical protein
MQEQVNKQAEVEELDASPCTGREVSDEEALQVFDWFLSGKYLIKNLAIIREEKQKALDELAHLEAAEKRTLDKIREQQINLPPDLS